MKDDSFSVDVITRILVVLSNEGNMKRTMLAGKTGLNYAALVRYVKFLKTLRWVDDTVESGSLISITNIGRSFRKLLEREDSPPDISEDVLEKLAMTTTSSREESEKEDPGSHYERKASYAKALAKTSTAAAADKDPRRGRGQSCLFCGNAIKGRATTREIGGETFSFDKRECATLFMKFRDVYGKEFLM